MADMWEQLGFSDNPYSTDPVPPNEEGVRLLVGRDNELSRLRMSIASSANHTTIEGANGVGKTSLVGVAAYTLLREHQKNPKQPLYIPIRRSFQLTPDDSADGFSTKFLIALAREITARRDLFSNLHHSGLRNLPDLDRWLNDPILTSGGGGASAFTIGASANISRSANSGSGFATGGVDAHLKEILSALFPDRRSGAFIGVIDNLELLGTVSKARTTLEELRDGVLQYPGMKWVLCGARGIVRSVVSTPRMQGRLIEPLEVAPLGPDAVTEVIRRRLDLFRARSDAYTPVEADGFRRIYQIGNHNLRIALKYCEDFVFWCMLNGSHPETSKDKSDLLDVWFAHEAEKATRDTTSVTKRGWELFKGISDRLEDCSPGDFGELGFSSGQAMQPYLRMLEQAGLIESAIDDADRRRKTIGLTPRGWIVRYQQANYQLPPP